MAISTKYFYIFFILFPILQAMRPIVIACLIGVFLGAVYVVYIQYPKIVISTMRTFTTQRFNQFNLSFPNSLLFGGRGIFVFIPKLLLTFGGAKSCFGWLSAVATNSASFPSGGVITSHTAIFYPRLSSIGFAKRNIEFLVTMLANKFNSIFSHSLYYIIFSKYFEIAKKRIEQAQMQPQLFTEPKQSEKQEELMS
jgi:hypothetical protein